MLGVWGHVNHSKREQRFVLGIQWLKCEGPHWGGTAGILLLNISICFEVNTLYALFELFLLFVVERFDNSSKTISGRRTGGCS